MTVDMVYIKGTMLKAIHSPFTFILNAKVLWVAFELLITRIKAMYIKARRWLRDYKSV